MKKLFNLMILFMSCGIMLAQVKNPTETIKNKSTDKINETSDDLIDKGIDKIGEGINSIFKKKDKTPKAETTSTNSTKNSNHQTTSGENTDYSSYKGSYFIPGKKLLFFEDFKTAKLGSGSGNWGFYEYEAHTDAERPNVRTISGLNGNWLKMPRKGFVYPNSFKKLPENFTIEFDVYADPKLMSEMEGGVSTVFVAREDREEYSIHWNEAPAISLDVHPHGKTEQVRFMAIEEYKSGVSSEERSLFDKTFEKGWLAGKVNRVEISRNGSHVKVYLNGKKYVDLSNALPKKANYNFMMSTNMWGDGILVSNIRIASDVPNASNDMKNDGKFVTNAIYFDVNSSKIKAESWATLNMAAQAIKGTSGTILIVGHTDSDGSDDANLTLSKNRANAVKNALVKEFKIDANRLQIDGKGESTPVATNDTPSGKAQNRRVEFILQ
jgi:OOP family OmpA-OmpF porin